MSTTATTKTGTITRERVEVVRDLGTLETELLDNVGSSWGMRGREVAHWADADALAAETPGERAAEWTAARLDGPTVVIAWIDSFGGVSFGVVRGAHRGTHADGETWEYFEASPIPGGWSRVTRDQILSVRHAETL